MTVLKQEQASGAMFLVETPNFAWKGKVITDNKLQEQRRKTEFIFQSFQKMGVHAVGVGEGESALGLNWVHSAAQKFQTPLVATNVSCESMVFPKIQQQSNGELQIAIVSLLPETTVIDGCSVMPVESSLKSIIENHEEVDVWIALSMLNINEQNELASTFPEVDIIVDGYSKALLSEPVPLENDAVRVSMGSKGKFFGVLDVNTQDPSKGYQLENGIEFYNAEVERIEQRLETLRSQSYKEEASQGRHQRRVAFYEKELAAAIETRDEFSAKPAIGNTVLLSKYELSKSIGDDEEIQADLADALSDIEALSER